MTAYAAVVLAGGAARRMGGRDKPAVPVHGRPMRDRVLAAVADAVPRVLVGSGGSLPADVLVTREEPAGGGPVAATAAGLALLGPDTTVVALLAADLPLLSRPAVGVLLDALAAGSGPGAADGVCLLDDRGRRQPLCGVWRVSPLRAALDRVAARRAEEIERAGCTGQAVPVDGAGPVGTGDRSGTVGTGEGAGPVGTGEGAGRVGALAGASMRELLGELNVRELVWSAAGPPPWFDCDTDADVRRAEEWKR
ncbi:NTP transferase domain-containing protein [Micromonospora sp. WMMD987]|uniref:molybdenum cofactor guanylyltransferase n=1 Tax=Micromonospora sp. WMMD987 TaxID=3016089 RepID=UPI00249C46D1|nr:NTP transferase domain-containing protein [Micromonospora sp. WMMD987]WFE95482.1 NTP transferase domain-containing protein [Micromonospora sp. WMMD987]